MTRLLALAALLAATAASAQDPAAEVARIRGTSGWARAAAAIDRGHDAWVADIVRLTEIPAPPFKEAERAEAYRALLATRRLTDVEIDAVGNVTALRRGAGGGGMVVVSAHLDTVFPEGTDVTVKRTADRLAAPGVGDDSTGLATLLSLVDALDAGDIRTRDDLLIVATVGEEGLGDLRGVRHLFTQGRYKGRPTAFFSLDGGGIGPVTTGGAGSKRYRVTFRGPGGHSYGAFGIVNPLAAMAGAVGELYRIPVPASPKTTYSASVVSGGTSVNAIPDEVRLEVDMRSESAAELAALEARFLAGVDRAVRAENAARSTREGRIVAEPKVIGDRPAGRTPATAPIVRAAVAAYAAERVRATLEASSTDANLPISLGIPAITISRNATGGRAHAEDEWIGTEPAPNALVKRAALLTVLAVAGMR